MRDEIGIQVPFPPENTTLQAWMTSGLGLAFVGAPLDVSSFFHGSGLPLPANATRDEIFNITVHVLTDGIYTCLTRQSHTRQRNMGL